MQCIWICSSKEAGAGRQAGLWGLATSSLAAQMFWMPAQTICHFCWSWRQLQVTGKKLGKTRAPHLAWQSVCITELLSVCLRSLFELDIFWSRFFFFKVHMSVTAVALKVGRLPAWLLFYLNSLLKIRTHLTKNDSFVAHSCRILQK